MRFQRLHLAMLAGCPSAALTSAHFSSSWSLTAAATAGLQARVHSGHHTPSVTLWSRELQLPGRQSKKFHSAVRLVKTNRNRSTSASAAFCGGPEQPESMAPHASEGRSEILSKTYDFRIIKEELKYSRYLQVFNRVVEHPPHSSKPDATSAAQRTVAYDVVGARTLSCHFVAVVPYHSATRTVTLLTEYAQGANSLVYGVPCGGLSSYHTSLEDCATRELSEEARLKGGRLIRLLPEGHPGLLEVKWCKNRFTPYLVVDPEPDTDPHPRDLEEFIEVHEVDLPTLKRLMYGGDMMLPSIVSCGMALDYLQENKLL